MSLKWELWFQNIQALQSSTDCLLSSSNFDRVSVEATDLQGFYQFYSNIINNVTSNNILEQGHNMCVSLVMLNHFTATLFIYLFIFHFSPSHSLSLAVESLYCNDLKLSSCWSLLFGDTGSCWGLEETSNRMWKQLNHSMNTSTHRQKDTLKLGHPRHIILWLPVLVLI